ncbi:DUF6445 family protein [Asticcacaulis sp. BYS171W]|uniref:DUF6445 family protein n=1 Tax=Asticcacaulis aquaticus TaxID=2984212 RepID=A0ABT5HYM6_9CAUL|nr:DUF6445 family protein [Asticcacaulis aquaticus]MDC7684546.1 DUF6445 family protein [Asticcacaulis aquaticus]
MIAEMDFDLNLAARPKRLTIGAEQEPLIVIDDVFKHPDRVVAYAAHTALFGPAGAAYPGQRAAVPEYLNQVLFYALQSITLQVFGISEHDEMSMTSSFAMVTQSSDQLSPSQRIPHFDAPDAKALAVVIYMCDPGWGGTSFYRHRASGFETVSPERVVSYTRQLDAEGAQTDLASRSSDLRDDVFARIHSVEARFNRLILYRSRQLHAADVTADRMPSDNPAEGRLTITSFLKATR